MTVLDALLLLMVLIWGSNFSIVKVALRDFPEVPFNAMRLVVGTIIFLAAMRWAGNSRDTSRPISRGDWKQLLFLGFVGVFLYQLCFVAGVKRTSVGNSSLIIGISPVVIALLSAMAGHERVTARKWLGVFLALAGLYFVVGHQVHMSGESWRGDALIIGGVLCWAVYSVASQPVLKRLSPLLVTGVTFSIGAIFYVITAVPVLMDVDWASISALSWMLMLASAVLALNVSYVIWYTALQRLGGTRTSMYSYLTPIIAMIVAAIWLGEPISGNQVAGAAAILAGLLLTRFAS